MKFYLIFFLIITLIICGCAKHPNNSELLRIIPDSVAGAFVFFPQKIQKSSVASSVIPQFFYEYISNAKKRINIDILRDISSLIFVFSPPFNEKKFPLTIINGNIPLKNIVNNLTTLYENLYRKELINNKEVFIPDEVNHEKQVLHLNSPDTLVSGSYEDIKWFIESKKNNSFIIPTKKGFSILAWCFFYIPDNFLSNDKIKQLNLTNSDRIEISWIEKPAHNIIIKINKKTNNDFEENFISAIQNFLPSLKKENLNKFVFEFNEDNTLIKFPLN